MNKYVSELLQLKYTRGVIIPSKELLEDFSTMLPQNFYLELYHDVFDKVAQFMTAGDQFVGTEPSPHSDQSTMYSRLITEEYNEFVEADQANDDVGRIDALGDMIVVIAGYAHSRGWDLRGALDEIMRSNLSKVDATTGKVIKREDGKILKPATYSPPELASFVA